MIRASLEGNVYRVTFPYSAALTVAMRAVPGAWYSDDADWTVPVASQEALREAFAGRPARWAGEPKQGGSTNETAQLNPSTYRRPKKGQATPSRDGKARQTPAPLPEGPGFVTAPYDHQRTALAHCLDNSKFALLMEMGTGKTKIIVDRMRWLQLGRVATRYLVVCPKAIMRTWEREIHKHSRPADMLRPIVLDGTADRRRKLLSTIGDGDVVIVNYDMLRTLLKDLIAQDFLMVILDESTRIKSPKSKTTKAAWKLGADIPYRYILTGTPITQSPMDAYGQFTFLDDKILGHKSFFSFRAEYARMMSYRPGSPTWQRQTIVGYKNLDRLKERLAEHSYRVLKEECLDLPPKLPAVTYEVVLSPPEQKAYDAMREDAMLHLERADGEMLDEFEEYETIIAPLVLTQMLRLQQLTSGFISSEQETPAGTNCQIRYTFDKQPAKIKVLMDLLADIDGPVIIWARFREEIRLIEEDLPSGGHVVFHGDVSTADRELAIADFQTGKVRYFIGQIQTGSLGITLTAASNVIYYSNSFSLADRLQSEDRAHRIGQKNTVSYFDLVARDTIDELVLEAIRAKKDIADYVTGDTLRRMLK